MLSRYVFWGRRKAFRRESDRQGGGYVDRYSPKLLFALTLLLGLNVLDSWFTILILDHGGVEVNPIVQSVIELYGVDFWAWKFGLVSVNCLILCLHSKFRPVDSLIFLIALIYLAVVLYQTVLLNLHIPHHMSG